MAPYFCYVWSSYTYKQHFCIDRNSHGAEVTERPTKMGNWWFRLIVYVEFHLIMFLNVCIFLLLNKILIVLCCENCRFRLRVLGIPFFSCQQHANYSKNTIPLQIFPYLLDKIGWICLQNHISNFREFFSGRVESATLGQAMADYSTLKALSLALVNKDDIFKAIFSNIFMCFCVVIEISLKFVPKGAI